MYAKHIKCQQFFFFFHLSISKLNNGNRVGCKCAKNSQSVQKTHKLFPFYTYNLMNGLRVFRLHLNHHPTACYLKIKNKITLTISDGNDATISKFITKPKLVKCKLWYLNRIIFKRNINWPCQPKVCNFNNVFTAIYQKIRWLQIPVKNFLRMAIRNAMKNLM